MTATAHPSRRRALQRLAAGAATLASPAFAQQGADANTVTVFVGAASAMDWGARLIADQIKEQLGRNAIVVPRLGAGQRLAIGECRRAAPDGRTFVFATNGPFSVNPHIYTKLEYDPDRDFTPVAGISSFDVALSIGPMTGARDFRALMDWARAKGKDAVYGSAPGQGSLSHFVGISLSLATKIPMEHVPYRDSGVGLVDLAAGRLPMMITGLTPQLALHKEGKIRILAVSGDRRSPLVPEVPTMREEGMNATGIPNWRGVLAPVGITPAQVNFWSDALAKVVVTPEWKQQLDQNSVSSEFIAGEAFRKWLAEAYDDTRNVMTDLGLVPK